MGLVGRILAQTDTRPSSSFSTWVTVTPSILSSAEAISCAGAGSLFLIFTERSHQARVPSSPAATRDNW